MSEVAPPPPPPYPAPPQSPYPANDEKKSRNVIGIVALIASVIGFIFAVMPGALIVGWVLLPISFILAIVSLFQKDKRKGAGISALIISIVGAIAGALVFAVVVADAVDDAFSGGDVTVSAPGDEEADGQAADDAGGGPAADEGDSEAGATRDNPYPVGSTVSSDDWSVTVNEVVLDATDEVMSANEFNEPPADGHQYLMVNITATYEGDDPDGDMPWVSVDYVTASGNTITSADAMVVEPEPFDSLETLYSGASASGNIALQVPSDTAAEGVLAVTPSMLGEKVFIAVE